MTKVPLVAKGGFTYMTRRLVAGDEFEARNPIEARILTRVRKVAEVPAPKAAKAAAKAEEAPEPTEPAKKAATRKAPAKRKAKAK